MQMIRFYFLWRDLISKDESLSLKYDDDIFVNIIILIMCGF